MRNAFRSVLVGSLLLGACASSAGPSPFDDDFPVGTEGDVLGGAPSNDSLPDDNKADAQYPVKLFLSEQSPVRNQGHRGVCSIFAATALVENLYIKSGADPHPDFSEQYMQWGVKNLVGDFANTEGSSAQSNLQFVVDYGTVKESVWPYEISPWSTSNDPACTGKPGVPTKCYTNGEPPAAADAAQKFQLPKVKYINTNSIKAHMTANGTGVVVGLTFFFQSWNHRLSTLPISSELWAQGAVTYPNQKDKDLSLPEHEGHAVLLVGWDDNLEMPMRDETGKTLVDADGKPKMEKGFWIFKNSWDTWSFGAENPYGAGYGFLSYRYVKEYGSAVSADLPKATTPPPPPTGGTTHDYSSSTSVAIPDDDTTGASSTISVTDTGSVVGAKVTLDISHTYIGDLVVTVAHGNKTSVLSNKAGGADDDIKKSFDVADFDGTDLGGDWVLHVEDTAAQDSGTVNGWSLEVTTN